ncbi:hypothetical protein HRI_002044400 [Hibiscus trionum]|uniref:Uncharacterized protein n=1 Tax=Hibiscus trionum TaxID=183268 RepID=A0A9W7M144_HIBTR|nr:hypothetical protein HRI_002044400 [Hibiscus trionum]
MKRVKIWSKSFKASCTSTKAELATATREADETMMDTMDEEHVDVAVVHMLAIKKMKITNHQVVDEDIEVEEEADINKEINLRYNVIIVISIVIIVTSVDQLRSMKKELM